MNTEYLLIVEERPTLVGPFSSPDDSENTLRKRLTASKRLPNVVLSIYYAYGASEPRIEPLNVGYLEWLRNETEGVPSRSAR